MTHPERALPLRDRKGYRGPAVHVPRSRALPADRLAELNALAALFAEENGDTEQLTASRQRVLFVEVGAYEDGAMDRAIRGGLRELGAPPATTTDTNRRAA